MRQCHESSVARIGNSYLLILCTSRLIDWQAGLLSSITPAVVGALVLKYSNENLQKRLIMLVFCTPVLFFLAVIVAKENYFDGICEITLKI